METIKPLGRRILVEVLPVETDLRNPLGLKIIDRKRHFDHVTRTGIVYAVGPLVEDVAIGEKVLFKGSAGRTLDGDPLDLDNPVKGEKMRWLYESEVLAVEVN